jgi:hypothetical protein
MAKYIPSFEVIFPQYDFLSGSGSYTFTGPGYVIVNISFSNVYKGGIGDAESFGGTAGSRKYMGAAFYNWILNAAGQITGMQIAVIIYITGTYTVPYNWTFIGERV